MIESQILPLVNAHVGMRNYYVKAYLGKTPSEAPKYWLAFSASVPPLGFSTYTISRAERTGFCEVANLQSLLRIYLPCRTNKETTTGS